MSVQEEISRLSGAKTDIANAIIAKGGSVPSGTTLDGMAELIMSIPSESCVKQDVILTNEQAGSGGISQDACTCSGDKVPDIDYVVVTTSALGSGGKILLNTRKIETSGTWADIIFTSIVNDVEYKLTLECRTTNNTLVYSGFNFRVNSGSQNCTKIVARYVDTDLNVVA